MMYQVVIEGQTIQLPAGIGEKDEDVKRAMSPYFPEVSSAMLTRKVEGEVTTITVVKRAGSKGAGLADLVALPARKNPAITLYEEIQDLGMLETADPVRLLELEARIDAALVEGARQQSQINAVRERLTAAQSQPAPAVVQGF